MKVLQNKQLIQLHQNGPKVITLNAAYFLKQNLNDSMPLLSNFFFSINTQQNLADNRQLTLQQTMIKPHDELARIQQYEGHLKRLLKLKQRPLTQLKCSQSNIKSHTRENSLNLKSKKVTTEQFQSENSPIKKIRTKTLAPLPLIPQLQKQLVTSSLLDKSIPERKAEIILQNYLLSRRILNVKSCIKNENFEKQFKKHKLYSILRSKSRIFSQNLQESRLKKFKQFQEESLKQSSIIGNGRYTFTFSIRKFQKIRRQSVDKTLYNLVVHLNKKHLRFNNLQTRKLHEDQKFHFRKKDISYPFQILVEIEMVIENQIVRYGWFIIDVNEPLCQMKGLSKNQDFSYEKKNEIEGIKSAKNQKLSGTIVFDYQITTEARQL